VSSATRTRLVFAGLYAAEGAPIGLIWWALPVWLRTDGTSPGDIARIMAWVTWPWALKFLWAPVVDFVRSPRFGLRGWILASQTVMGLSVVPLLFLDLSSDPGLLLAILIGHAIAAATQDAAIDSLAIVTVPAAERGAINGWMQVGMLGARAVFGGGAILMAEHIGRTGVLVLLIATILTSSTLLLRLTPEPLRTQAARSKQLALYARALGTLFRRRTLWVGLAFASLAGAGFEGLASLAGPLLLDRGASEALVGFVFLLPAVVAMALGALAGGWLSDRFGRRRVTALGEALAALFVLAVGSAALAPSVAGPNVLIGLYALLYFAAGMATSALYSLLMELADPAFAATQFCTFMAGINLCYVWSARALGELVDHFGYGPGIICLGLVSLGTLPLLKWMTPDPRGERGSSDGDVLESDRRQAQQEEEATHVRDGGEDRP